ncbi:ABC transporter permease [Paenibacillus donghaensis]|uniref:ABC transporter permease n=1 Tax=Paenibacillus donghaensis TaxID=414771 RepID=A0A2Z2KJ32_9BACL|nr:ABC transporter permease [Paenibacillus donghaensis]ASA23263.1 hypothetical protein B9T62_22100 [Paenibacillus donghaensis]
MINLLRMDLYRFKKNRIMALLLLIFCAFQIFGIFMMRQYESTLQDIGIPVRAMNESQFMQHVLSQSPSWMLMYIMVFSVYFYLSEHQSGFYKNYISMNNARTHSTVSKILILALFTGLMFVTLFVADLAGRAMFFDQASIGDWGYLLKMLIGQFLLHWAFAILMLCISMITRHVIVSITAGLILALNVVGMLLAGLESLMSKVQLSQYLLVNTIMSSKDLNHSGDLIHVGGVAVFSILLFSWVAVRFKQREDLG